MFKQKHRLCPACDARVAASAVQCPECGTKITPVRRFDPVRITLAVTVVLVLAGAAVWAMTVEETAVAEAPMVAPRDWWNPDSAGLAIDSAIDRRFRGDDTTAAADSILLLTGGRTDGCSPYDPRQYQPPPGSPFGPLFISNRSDRVILVTIYRPDGEAWTSVRRRVSPGGSYFLTASDGRRMIARTNWGVQVESYCIELLEAVAGWTGRHFTLTWGGPDPDG